MQCVSLYLNIRIAERNIKLITLILSIISGSEVDFLSSDSVRLLMHLTSAELSVDPSEGLQKQVLVTSPG